MDEGDTKRRVDRARRAAAKRGAKGYAIRKSRVSGIDRGTYSVIDLYNNVIVAGGDHGRGLTLDELERWLEETASEDQG